MAHTLLDTPVGPVYLETTERGLRHLTFANDVRQTLRPETLEAAPAAVADLDAAEALLVEVQRQLDAYFDGDLREFDLPLDMVGTPFQRRVWQAIASIPFGQTASYAEVAVSAGAPNAYRAAGTACGSNPVAIIVPCHRVVGTDRGLHGFGGGLDSKIYLLRHEGSLGSLRTGLPPTGRTAKAQKQAVLI